MPTILQVEEKILETLKINDFETDYDFQQLLSGQINQITTPAALITSSTGTPKPVAQKYKLVSLISVYLVIHDESTKHAREAAMVELVNGLYNILTNNLLGLELCKGLTPRPYNNVTQTGGKQDFQALGFLVYKCDFEAELMIHELPQPENVERGPLGDLVAKFFDKDLEDPVVESVIE